MIASLLLLAALACPPGPGATAVVGPGLLAQSGNADAGAVLRLLAADTASGGVTERWEAGALLTRRTPRRVLSSREGQIIRLTAEQFAAPPLGDTRASQPAALGGLVLVGASDGLLHAFAIDSGQERFAYLPASLLTQAGQGSAAPSLSTARFLLAGRARQFVAAAIGAGQPGVFALELAGDDAIGAWEVGALAAAQTPDLVLLRVDGKPSPFMLAVGETIVLQALDASQPTPMRWTLPGARRLSRPGFVTNADGSVRFAYLGDSLGQVWRLDFRAARPQDLALPQRPLFRALDARGWPQAIMAAPRVLVAADGGYLVVAGTADARAANSVYAVPDTEAGLAHTRTRSEVGIAGHGWIYELDPAQAQVLQSPQVVAAQLVLDAVHGEGECGAVLSTIVLDPLTGKQRKRTATPVAQIAAIGPILVLPSAVRSQATGPHQSRDTRQYALAHLDRDGRLRVADTLTASLPVRRLSWRELPGWQPPGAAVP